ncbi:MAG: ABC transporter ATP-binding protein, partial [Catonella sp.]
DKTVIMIAHRLSSIRNADEILVVDGGKIVECGTDKELMAANGRYKEFQDMFAKATDWRVYD